MTLFSADELEPTLTVTEVNRAVDVAMRRAFAERVWVRGEVQRFRRSKPGHVYFELVEKDELRDRVKATMSVVCFRDEWEVVARRLRQYDVELADDTEVRIGGRPGLWVAAGKAQFALHAVDPTFTLGKLAAERARLLKALATEGLLRANAACALSVVPLRLGLVASRDTAGYRDFVHELETSGYDFRACLVDVRVQGDVAARRIAAGLRRLAALPLDAVVVIRGGGSRADLAAFDAEAVARAIAAMPVPVLTGIGHESDRTVADEVAHTSAKTPTACAQLLCARVSELVGRLDAASRGICTHARQRVRIEQRAVVVVGGRAARAATGACRVADTALADRVRRAGRAAPAAIGRRSAALDRAGATLAAMPRRRLGALDERVVARATAIAPASGRVARTAARKLDAGAARLRALDPQRVLERGYSITRDADGAVVRHADGVVVGGRLRTELADGVVTSTVETTERRDAP